jgi:hypothetical protein
MEHLQMSKEWIENLKVGDKVIEVNSRQYTPDSIDTVERLTKTMIVLEKACGRFNRRGFEVGDTTWGGSHLVEATPERIVILQEEIKKRLLVNRLGSLDWTKLPTDHLQRVWEVVIGEPLDKFIHVDLGEAAAKTILSLHDSNGNLLAHTEIGYGYPHSTRVPRDCESQ